MEIKGLMTDDFTVEVPFQDATVTIRYVSLEELARIQKKATRRSWDRRHQPVEEVDRSEANRLLGEAAVKGWRKFTLDGQEYPFTPENRDLLMARWVDFSRFVNDVCVDLQALQAAEKEQALGNSDVTSGHGQTTQG